MPEMKKCPTCGVEHNNAKFCSNKCVGKSQRRTLIKCLNCGEDTRNKKFCSRKCSASYNTGGRVRTEESREKTRQSVLNYLYPDGNFPVRSKIKKINFSKKNIKQISEDMVFENLPTRWKKRVIYYERGNKCEMCGFEYADENAGKGPFEIHHKDGNNKNWLKDNLEINCLNCHWKTPNYRFRNRKHSENTRKLMKEKTTMYYKSLKLVPTT